MTPQSNFMVVAPIRAGQTEPLRQLLASMNRRPGVVDPGNGLVPFENFDRLHFARFVVLQDLTTGDLAKYGEVPPNEPDSLAFFGDCDGPRNEFLVSLVAQAEPGLRKIFSYCEQSSPDDDLFAWMMARELTSATTYVNWIGRTVQQIREEKILRDFLVQCLGDGGRWQNRSPHEVHAELRAAVCQARLMPGPLPPTPLVWRIKNFLHLVGVPLVLLLLSPLLLLFAPLLLLILRWHERTDPEIDEPADAEHVRRLAEIEDHEVTNQFTAMGSVKPGLFRRELLTFLLWVTDYAARHVFNRGYLARVTTIHSARWVFLGNKRRLVFASNYDGSLESYNEDFINKVGWGLNLSFSNGVGYPRTAWLVLHGAKYEQKFKRYIRRHQLATEVWFNAHPSLTAVNLETNSRIRDGLEKTTLSDTEAAEWLQLFS